MKQWWKKHAGQAAGVLVLLILAGFGLTYWREIWAVLTQPQARDAFIEFVRGKGALGGGAGRLRGTVGFLGGLPGLLLPAARFRLFLMILTQKLPEACFMSRSLFIKAIQQINMALSVQK